MLKLSLSEYERMRRGADVLSRDSFGEKVLSLPGGQIIKLFRLKRFWSSARFFPYANRFAHNASELTRRGIGTVRIDGVYRIPAIHRDAVAYKRLDGISMRDALLEQPRSAGDLIPRWAALLATLHHRGIHFRAGHFGNVLVGQDGALSVIDVCDTRFQRGPLSTSARATSMRPALRYACDAAAIRAFGPWRFINAYFRAEPSTVYRRQALLDRLSQIDPLFDLIERPFPVARVAFG